MSCTRTLVKNLRAVHEYSKLEIWNEQKLTLSNHAPAYNGYVPREGRVVNAERFIVVLVPSSEALRSRRCQGQLFCSLSYYHMRC